MTPNDLLRDLPPQRRISSGRHANAQQYDRNQRKKQHHSHTKERREEHRTHRLVIPTIWFEATAEMSGEALRNITPPRGHVPGRDSKHSQCCPGEGPCTLRRCVLYRRDLPGHDRAHAVEPAFPLLGLAYWLPSLVEVPHKETHRHEGQHCANHWHHSGWYRQQCRNHSRCNLAFKERTLLSPHNIVAPMCLRHAHAQPYTRRRQLRRVHQDQPHKQRCHAEHSCKEWIECNHDGSPIPTPP